MVFPSKTFHIRISRGLLVYAVGLVGFVGCLKYASGITLAPGGAVSISGIKSSTDPSLNGTTIAQSDITFAALAFGTQLFTGDLKSSVVRERSGALDFYYQIINNSGADVQLLDGLAVSGFSGTITDVNFRTDMTGQIAPSAATRTSTGDIVKLGGFPFQFGTFFPAGGATVPLIIKTDAVDFSSTAAISIQFVDAQSSAGVPPQSALALMLGFAPDIHSGSVPEPTSAGLLICAIGALMGYGKLKCRIS